MARAGEGSRCGSARRVLRSLSQQLYDSEGKRYSGKYAAPWEDDQHAASARMLLDQIASSYRQDSSSGGVRSPSLTHHSRSVPRPPSSPADSYLPLDGSRGLRRSSSCEPGVYPSHAGNVFALGLVDQLELAKGESGRGVSTDPHASIRDFRKLVAVPQLHSSSKTVAGGSPGWMLKTAQSWDKEASHFSSPAEQVPRGTLEAVGSRGAAAHRKEVAGWYTCKFSGVRRCIVCGIVVLLLLILGAIGGIVAGTLISKHNNSSGMALGTGSGTEQPGQSGMGSALGGHPNPTAPSTTMTPTPTRGGKLGYDALVVFGASYCDNAHHRRSQFNSSLKPSPYFGGRWTNGRVWNEYLAATLGPNGTQTKLVNYAFGGAPISNAQTPKTVPDLGQQTSAFLSDVASGFIGTSVKQGKSLVAIWIGINTVTATYDQMLHGLQRARTKVQASTQMTSAQSNITASVQTITQIAQNLSTSPAFGVPPDFLILPLPPAADLLIDQQQTKNNNTALAIVTSLNKHFNDELSIAISTLEASLNTSAHQKAYTWDMPTLFHNMVTKPASYGLSVIDKPCFDGQKVCPNADQFLFWDTLHPTTTVHQKFASALAQLIIKE